MTLVLPPRLTASAVRVRDAARRRRLHTIQLPTFEVPAGLNADHLHAGPAFADAVAPPLGIAVLEAPADWLTALPHGLTRRRISLTTLGEAYGLRRPAFVKTPNDKTVPARIYTDGSRLPGPDALDRSTPVLVVDIVEVTAEYRLYLLDGAVHTASGYAQDGRLCLGPPSPDALAFGADLAGGFARTLPTAIVVDVGVVDGGWAVIEANAAWASGMYAADPDLALDVILRAAGPAAEVGAHDRVFVRQAGAPARRCGVPGDPWIPVRCGSSR